MKILCFHPALAPYRVDFFNLLGEFSDLKLIFLQANLQTQKFDQKTLLAKLKFSYEHLTGGFVFRGRCMRTGILRVVRRERPDVILSYEASPVTLELILLKKLGLIRAKIWTSMDDSPDQVKSRRGLRRAIRDCVLRNVEKVIVPSDAAKAAYESIVEVRSRMADGGFNRVGHVETCRDEAKYAVVPIIHDTVTMRRNSDRIYTVGLAWRRSNCPKKWKRVLMFVGRFAEVKNLPWLIEQICQQPETTGLVLVGDGVLEAELKAMVTALKLDRRVVFAGRKEGDDLYSMMSMADALVLCSHSETFGAVVAEALQWGTPCVVAKHLGASVLIEDGKNGALFEKGDSAGFRSAISHLPPRAEVSLLLCDLRAAVKDLVDGGAA